MKNASFLSILSLSITLTGLTARADGFSVQSWSKDLKTALEKDPAQASKLLDLKAVSKQALTREDSADREAMKQARLLFAQGKFEQALAKYNSVSKESDVWLESVEEKGWAFHREKDFEKTLAQTKTLLSQPFMAIVGSEPFFLQSLSQLKICDYKGVLETHKLFKESQRQRLLDLQGLANTGKSEALNKVVAKTDQFPMTFKEVGEETKALPRQFYRDLKVQQILLEMKMAETALPMLRETAAKPALKAKIASTIARLQKAEKTGRAQLESRMKELAQRETDQNFKILQKLNLIEVETIQRIHADREMDKNSFRKGEYAQAGDDQMIFPDDGRPWMDELDKYQVKANTCPQNIRRKM